MDYTLSLITSFFSEIFGTLFGVGAATFFVPFTSFFLNFKEVLGIVAFLHVLSNIERIFFFWKNINYRIALAFGLPSVVFIAISSRLTTYFSVDALELSLGLVLLISSLYQLLVKRIKLPGNDFSLGIFGSITGFIGGLTGTSGAVRSAFLLNVGLSKDAFIGTSVAVDFFSDIIRLVVYIFNGFVKLEIIPFLPLFFVVGLLGTYIAKSLLKYIPNKYFDNMVVAVLLIASISTIINALMKIH